MRRVFVDIISSSRGEFYSGKQQRRTPLYSPGFVKYIYHSAVADDSVYRSIHYTDFTQQQRPPAHIPWGFGRLGCWFSDWGDAILGSFAINERQDAEWVEHIILFGLLGAKECLGHTTLREVTTRKRLHIILYIHIYTLNSIIKCTSLFCARRMVTDAKMFNVFKKCLLVFIKW